MKPIKLITSLLGSLTLVVSSLITSASAQANKTSTKYFCAILNDTPHTFVGTARGNVAIITWLESDNHNTWTPLQRCIEVGKRFQRFHDNGTLKEIATGTVNGLPVLCAVPDRNTTCNAQNILVTLPPDADRHEYVQQLLDSRGLATGRSLRVRGRGFETNIVSETEVSGETYNGEKYYDINIIETIGPTVNENLVPVGNE